MNTNELKDLNNSNFSDSPVASKQATESTNLPSNDPIKINNRASGRGRNRNNTPVLTPTAYDYQNDRELAFQQGYASSNQSLGNIISTPYGDDYFDAKWMGISFGTTTDATRNPYSGINPLGNNVDFEHLRRNTQSTLGATVNTATQFVGKTLVNTVGGVVGGFYSLGSAIANLDSSKFYDNSVNRALDKATEWVDENNSVFTSQKANNENSLIGFNVETMKNLSDGFSFIAGAVLSEITTAGLASGAIALSAGTKLGRLGKLPLSLASKLNTEKASGLLPGLKSYGEAVKKAQDAIELVDDTSKLSRSLSQAQRAERLAEVLGDTSQTIENIKQASEALRNYSNLGRGLRTTVTGTFWEAGLEARQAKDEFKETNLRKAFEDIDNMSITEAEKENLKQAKEREIEELSNNAGLMTFGLNALVLKASNAIQFPSVFGAPSKLKPNEFANQFKKGIDGKFTLPKNVKATDVGRYLGAIVKNAATEGAEELSQGLISGTSQDYYKDILQSRTSDKVIHGQTASFLNSLGNTIESSVGEKDFWREGVIGAVMGAVGLPMLKRNKKGKLRPVWTGGMQEDIKQVNAYRQDRSLALTRLNELKNDLDDINGYNVDRAKRLELLNRRDDLAMLTGNDQEYEDNRQHKIYNLVTDAKNKGLDSYLQDSLDEIQEMDLNEYESRFGYEKGTLTKEMMEADKKDTIDSFKRFSDAYDMVYKNLRMDDIKNSRVGTKMFDMLVHSVGFEQYLNKQLDLVKSNIINSDFWKNLDYSEAEFEQVMQDTVEYKSAMENFNYRLDQAINKEYNRLQDDIKANEQVYNDNLNLLPDNIKQIFSEGFNTYNELLKAGKNVEAQNVLEALTSSLSTATSNLEDNTEINGKSVSQFANDLFKQKTDLYKKLNGLDKETIKKNIAKEGSPEYLEWKKTLNEEIDAINKQLKEKHEKDTKLMLDKGQAQKLTLSQVLGVVESNNRFQSASRKAAALARLNKPSLMNQIQKDSIDIHNELMKFEVMYAKKLSTVRMASQLLNTSPANAYRRTAMMEFDANMDMLRIQTYELQYSKANMDSEGLDTVVIDLAYVKTSLEKLNKDMKDLKDEFGITDKMLAEQQKFIDEVQTIVNSVESLLKGEDLKDQAADAAQKELDKKSSEKTNDALNEDERLKAQFEANMNNPLQQGNVPGQQAQAQTAEQQQAMDEIPTADGVRPLFQTKPFYTIYPTDNANTVRPGFSTIPIGVKVKEGEIRYNQTATLNLPLEDELADDGLVQYLRNIGVSVEDYRQGREKVRNAVKSGNLDVIFGDFNSLDPQVKTYILNARLIFDIYDSKIKLRRGRQVADTSGNLVHSMYFYAPQQNSKETVDKARESLNKELKDLNDAYEAKVLEIQDNNNLTAEGKQDEISKLSYKHDIATNNIMSKYDNIISDKNFYTNFELRRQAIVHSLNNANEALPLRIGGFLNGVIQLSSSIKTAELDLFNLSNDYTAENYNLDDTVNPLIDDLDNFNLDNLVYVTSEHKGREMRTFSDNSPVTLNDGSLVIKDYGNTGEVYFIHETKNGQKVPIKLNRNKLGYNPELVTEIAKIFESYLVNKKKDAKLPKSDNPLMSVFNNLTYAEFFELMFKPLMSNTNPVDVDSMNLISLDNDGNIRYGSQKLTKASDLDQGSNANVYNAVIKAISNARPVIHNKYISNKGSKQLNAMGKWFINNGFLTHTFTTGDSSSNVDKVFLRDPNKAVPFSIHMLNTDINRQSNRTTGTRKKRDAIKSLFDKFGLFGDKITLTSYEQNKATIHDLIEELYLQTQSLPEGAELSEGDIVGIIQNVFNNKMLQILELIKTYPEVANNSKIKNVFKKYQSFNDVNILDVWRYIKDSNNTLDLYIKNYIDYLYKIKSSENRLNKLRGYYKKYKTALDGRVIPVNTNQNTTSSQAQEGVSQNNVQVITLPIKQKDGSFKDNIYTVNPNEGTITNSKGKPIKASSPVGKKVLALVNWEVDNPDGVETTNLELETLTKGSSIDGNNLISETDDFVAQNGGQVVPEVNGKNIANPTDFVEQTPEDDAVLTTLGAELNAPIDESNMTSEELSAKQDAISSDFNEALGNAGIRDNSNDRSNETEYSEGAEEGGTDIDNQYDPDDRKFEEVDEEDYRTQADNDTGQVFTNWSDIFNTPAVVEVSENEAIEFNNSESKKIDESNININKDMGDVNLVINSKLASFTITNVKGVVFKTKVNSIVKEINNRNLNFDISVKENYVNFASNIYNSVVDKNTNDNDKKTIMSELVKFGNNLGISNITPNEINCNF